MHDHKGDAHDHKGDVQAILLVQFLHIISHLLHLERRPDERANALAVVVAYRLTNIILE